MDVDQPDPSEKEPGPVVSDSPEAQLAYLMAGCSDLDEACEKGLRFTLATTGQSDGALILVNRESLNLNVKVVHGHNQNWADLLDDHDGLLRQLVRECLFKRSPTTQLFQTRGIKDQPVFATAFPIAEGNQAWGILLVLGEPLSQTQIDRLNGLALVLGRFIRIFQPMDNPKKRLRQSAMLQAELAELALNADLENLQKSIIWGTNQVLESEVSILVLIDEDDPSWHIYKALDCDSRFSIHLQPDENKGPVSDCIKTGEVITREGSQAHLNFDPTCSGEGSFQVRSLLCAPLKLGDQIMGALIALNKAVGGFEDSDRQIIAALAKSAASYLHTVHLIQYYRVQDASQEANRWEGLASQNVISTLIDYLPASLYIIDQDYRLQTINKARRIQTGKSEAELIGRPCHQVLFGRDTPCLECKVRETLDQGKVTHRTERRQGQGDEIFDWEITSYPITEDIRKDLQAVLMEVDVTEKRRLEAILTQSEKLAAVGQLAAGIAHEINNPLTAIIANAQILHREIPPDAELQESIELITRAGARAAQVVHNLLDFARKEEYRLKPTDVNKTIELAAELVQHELVSRGAILEVDLDRELPTILASADDLQSVWLNLLLNALDSLDKTPARVTVSAKLRENELQITFTDNGKGIPFENLSRIFEPFYTTKAPGRGTGLGLSVSHNIVKQLGGYFRVNSQIGEGSSFTVVFPVA